jgi:hypothetical protein
VDWHEQRSRFIEKRVEILDAVVEHVGDPFGQVSHGWICVKGPLVENVSLSDTGQTAFLDFTYPDYLGESPPAEVHCLLLFTSRLYTDKKFFLLLIVRLKDPTAYERYGTGLINSKERGMGSNLTGLSAENWLEKTITII